MSNATHNATSNETRARCSRTTLWEPVVRLALAEIPGDIWPRIARMAGTADAPMAVSMATTTLNSCTRQSISTTPRLAQWSD